MSKPSPKQKVRKVKGWAVVSKEYGVNYWPPYLHADDQYDIFPTRKVAQKRAQEWTRNGTPSKVVSISLSYLQ